MTNINICMSRLHRLIEISEKAFKEPDSFISTFKYPGLFLSSLKELNDLVGNETIKDSIASQIIYLIATKNDTKDVNAQPVMLNTLLYGPPGTGKTIIATKLAKIWYAMGLIEENSKSSWTSELMTNSIYLTFGIYLLIYGSFIFMFLSQVFRKARDFLGVKLLFILVVILLFIIIIATLYSNNNYQYKLNNTPVKDSDIVKVVSREDFIDKYIGGTDKKTKDLLTANTGKVLFIDEAYSLYNGRHDEYGMEALTTLNRYLSEHPNKIMVIMAGYKNLIQEKILKVQPGLKSRFMWHFECNGYNAQELYYIFLLMMRKERWTLAKGQKRLLYQLLASNISAFKAYARDVQRLIFFSQLEYSEKFIIDPTVKSRELTIEMIQQGLNILKQNNLEVDDEHQSESLKDIIQLMNDEGLLPNKEENSFKLDDSSMAFEELPKKRYIYNPEEELYTDLKVNTVAR